MAPSWELFYNVSAKIQATSSYQNDLVDVGRQVIVGLFIQYYQLWVQAYNKFDTDGMRKYSDLLLQLLVDEDMLMGTQQLYMLGYWIEQAQSFAQSPLELLQYKYNAINQLTFWGPTGQINDYASKEWNGLLGFYYYGRYLLFFEESYAAAAQFQKLDYNKFIQDCYKFEDSFQETQLVFPSTPIANTLTITKQLITKWKPNIQQIC